MAPRELLLGSFQVALAAADPLKIVGAHLPAPPKGRTLVVGAGKAAASMALAVEQHWPVSAPLDGLVITRYQHGLETQRITVIEAGHPVPDESGEKAAQEILHRVKTLTADDLLLVLVSGGGSSLLTLPADGIAIDDIQTLTRQLLASGAPIQEMNIVRKHLSAIKGGRLAAAASPAKVVTLVISDVPGDDPSIVASGPTVADKSTFVQAQNILRRYGISEPRSAVDYILRAQDETPKPGDPRLAGNEIHVIATARKSLEAAAGIAGAHGLTPIMLGDAIEGEARLVGAEHGKLALDILAGRAEIAAPCILLSGGETTVTVRHNGRGGRNAEYLLGLALAVDGNESIHALAGDTDGIDGSEANAGACFDPNTLQRARRACLDPLKVLDGNDAFTLFEKTGDLVVTGPTLTNVNDFRAVVVK